MLELSLKFHGALIFLRVRPQLLFNAERIWRLRREAVVGFQVCQVTVYHRRLPETKLGNLSAELTLIIRSSQGMEHPEH